MNDWKKFTKKEKQLIKKKSLLKETFGKLKFKKSTKELLKESDKEDWDE